MGEKSYFILPPSFWGSAGHCWHFLTCTQKHHSCLCDMFTCGIFLCACVSPKSPLHKETSPVRFGVHPTAAWGLPPWLSGKELVCNARDAGDADSIPGSGRSPGEGNGNPLEYSCLENPTDRGAWRVTVHGVSKSQTRLSN